MAWVKLDDAFYDHQKFIEAGPLAGWLWMCSLAWSNRNLTDGFIPLRQVGRLANFEGLAHRMWSNELIGGGEDVEPAHLVAVLLDVCLWEEVEGGYLIHDFHDYQPEAAQVRERRELRADAGRKGGKRSAEARREQTAKADPSPAEANGQANGQANSEQTAKPSRTPVPVPVPNPDPLPKTKPDLRSDQRSNGLALVSDSVSPAATFEDFWTSYPRRNGKRIGKADAETVWKRLTERHRNAAMVAVVHYAQACDGGTMAMDAHRWLTKRRWDDWQEPAVPDQQRTNGRDARWTAGVSSFLAGQRQLEAGS